MGLSHHQTYTRTIHLRARLQDLFSSAKRFHFSHDTLLSHRDEAFSGNYYKRLPQHAKEYLRGYWDAEMRCLEHYELEWRNYVPANPDICITPGFYTSADVRKMELAGYKNIHSAICKFLDTNKDEALESNWFWKGTGKTFY